MYLDILLLIIWSFIEAIFFPIPVDIILVYLVKEKNYNPYFVAFLAVLFNTLGSSFGYKIGEFISKKYKKRFHNWVERKYNVKIDKITNERLINYFYFLSTVLPLPQKVFAFISGYFKTNILIFLIYTIIGRSIRFFTIALLAQKLSWKLIITLAVLITLLYFVFDRVFYIKLIKMLNKDN